MKGAWNNEGLEDSSKIDKWDGQSSITQEYTYFQRETKNLGQLLR